MDKFKINAYTIDSPFLINLHRFADGRGFFSETYRSSEFERLGLPAVVQTNISRSAPMVARGAHVQRSDQWKYVMCLEGEIVDFAVDVRPTGTPGRLWSKVLSAVAGAVAAIPPGWAHGFAVRTGREAVVSYALGGAEYDDDLETGFDPRTVPAPSGSELRTLLDSAELSPRDRKAPPLSLFLEDLRRDELPW